MLTRVHRLRLPGARAFSLVEVTMAIGIASFAVLSIVGTMSVGLAHIRESKNDVEYVEIVSQVASAAMQTPFDQVEDFADAGPYFFSQGGRLLDSSDGAVYRATVTVVEGDASTYPGAPTGLGASAKSVAVTVVPWPAARPEETTVFIVPKS